MTTSALDTRQPISGTVRVLAALRTLIQNGAEHRQLRRELGPYGVGLSGVAPGDDAVTREIRAMLRA